MESKKGRQWECGSKKRGSENWEIPRDKREGRDKEMRI